LKTSGKKQHKKTIWSDYIDARFPIMNKCGAFGMLYIAKLQERFIGTLNTWVSQASHFVSHSKVQVLQESQ